MKVVPDFEKGRIALVSVDVQKVYDAEIMGQGADPDDWGAWRFKEAGQNAAQVLAACRRRGYPVFHLAYVLDDLNAHPLDERDEAGRLMYSVRGTLGAEIIDAMAPRPGEAVVEKSRYSGFYGTDLDNMLRSRGIEHLIMLGGFTDACLLETVYGAWSRNYSISLVKDASTAGSEGAHKAAVLTMANWVWGISIFETREMVEAIDGRPYRAWFWERSHALPYTTANIDELYNQLK